MESRETALAVLARIAGRQRAELTAEKNLVGDLGIDSPKAIELMLELEEAFGVEISDHDAASMDTVGDLIALADRLA
jgi:acyl carrier protein